MLQETWQRWAPGQEFRVSASFADYLQLTRLGPLPWSSKDQPWGELDSLLCAPSCGSTVNRSAVASELDTIHTASNLRWRFISWAGSNLSWIINWKSCKASSLSWSKLLYSARRDLSMEEVFQRLLFLDVSLIVTYSVKCCFFPIHRVGSWDACS